jgi:hypothetical protein
MKLAVDQLGDIGSHINMKIFKHDMIILHTSKYLLNYLDQYGLYQLSDKLKSYFKEKTFITLNTFSDFTRINNFLLSKVLLEEMLDRGLICIDESDLEVRYYHNSILYKLV